jgi:hypothetical protein
MATLDHVESVEADEGREVVEEFWEKAIESKCEGLMIKASLCTSHDFYQSDFLLVIG